MPQRGIEVLRLLGPRRAARCCALHAASGSPNRPCCASCTPWSGRAGVAIDRRRAVAALAGVDRGAERARDRSRLVEAAAPHLVALQRTVLWPSDLLVPRLRDGGRGELRRPLRAGAQSALPHRLPGGHPALRARAVCLLRCNEREAVLAHWRAASPSNPRTAAVLEGEIDAPWRRRDSAAMRCATRSSAARSRTWRASTTASTPSPCRSSPMAGCAGRSTWWRRGATTCARRWWRRIWPTCRPAPQRSRRARVAAPALSTAAPSRSPFSAGGALQVAFHGVEVAAHAYAWPGSRASAVRSSRAASSALALAGEQAEGEVEARRDWWRGRACRAARARPRPRSGSARAA